MRIAALARSWKQQVDVRASHLDFAEMNEHTGSMRARSIRLSMAISSSRLRRKMARRRFDDHSRPQERPIADRSPSRLSPNPQLANHGNCDRGEETRRRLSSIQRVLAPLVVCRCPKRACDTTAYQRFRSSYRGAIRLPHRALCVPGASQRNARGSEPNVTFRPEFAFFRPLIPDTTL